MKKTFAFLIIINVCIIAQGQFGLGLEPFASLATVEKISFGPAGNKANELSFEWNLGFTLSLMFEGTDNLSISLRAGLIPGNLYGGIDGGFYWIYNFTKDKYLIAGVNTHLNAGFEGSHNGAGSEAVTIPFLIIGGGYKFSKHGLAELQFNYSLNNVSYGFKRETRSIPPYYIYHYYKMPWIIKLSMSYEWEL